MGLFVNNYYNVEDYWVSEKEKNDFDYLKKSVDFYISYLVREKKRLRVARNLYDGRRDREEFKYLEDTFGIETPIAVKMTPIVKTRIDVLLGILLDEVFTYRVTVNDENTITAVENARKKEKAHRIIQEYRAQLQANIQAVSNGQEPQTDAVTDRILSRIERSINEDFISEFEIACQSLIKFFEQDSSINMKQKMKQFFLDFLVTGEAYYRTYVRTEGEDPVLEICRPENVFFSKNLSHQFISEGHDPNVNAIVHRVYMKRSEILHRYGHLMNEVALKRIFGQYSDAGGRRIVDPRQLDYMYRHENYYDSGNIHNQHNNTNMDTLPVYHVEWLANNPVELEDEEDLSRMETVDGTTASKIHTDSYGENPANNKAKKVVWRLDRYEGIRIGNDIYINLGRSQQAPRSIGRPWATKLSYNGVVYNDRGSGDPYSLALSLKDIQDSYDIIKFFRDNLIANAGVDGSRINLAGIPKMLGKDYMERLMKFLALRKQGIEVYDPTEDGANLFQHYGDFSASINPGTIEALAIVLESLEREADIVTGVNRHMYQAAETRDAVANVKVGQQTTSLITKDIFELIYNCQKFILEDLIDRAKFTYKTGKRGSYIVGHRQVLFSIQPDHYCFTDFNINVVNNSKFNNKFEKVIAFIPELIKINALSPDTIIKVAMSDSTTEILQIVSDDLAKKTQEGDQLQQLGGQLQQMQGQIKQYEQELAKAQKQLEAANKVSDGLREREVEVKELLAQATTELGKDRLALDTKKANSEAEKDKMVVQLEREQLYAENVSGNAKEVRNNL